MENQKVSPVKTAMKWGLLLGAINIASTLVTYFMDGYNPENQDSIFSKIIRYGTMAIVILFLVIAMQEHRDKELNGYMTYARGLGLGTLMGLFYGVIAGLIAFVVFKYLVPADFIDKTLETTREQMLERNPNMSDDDVEMGLSWTRTFMKPQVVSVALIFFWTAICFGFSLLVAAFIQKKDPNEF